MATENWYPISAAPHDLPSGHDDFTNTGGANKNASTRVGGGRSGPATHDDATSYISEGTNGEDQALNIDWPPMSVWDGVLTAGWRVSVSGASAPLSFNLYMVNAAGASGGAIVTESLNNTGFKTTGPVDISNGTTYRPGGGSWSAADFGEAVTFARTLRAGGPDGTCLVTSVWGEISFTPPGGAFVFLLQLAGLGALPFVGAMDFSHFLRFLSWRRLHHPRHTVLTGDEVRQAWRELRAYRAPRFFLPAI